MCGNADLVELDVPQFDRDFSTAGHGVAGVDHEVHHDLLDLRRVRQNRREVGPHVGGDLNVGPDDPQHVLHAFDEMIERNGLLGDHLAAAEGEQLTRESRRALRGLDNLLRVGAPLVARLEALHEHFGVAMDGHEQVVEVMRDPPASRPMASIFCACRNCSSRCLRCPATACAP